MLLVFTFFKANKKQLDYYHQAEDLDLDSSYWWKSKYTYVIYLKLMINKEVQWKFWAISKIIDESFSKIFSNVQIFHILFQNFEINLELVNIIIII